MAGPWEDYAPQPKEAGPWADYKPQTPQVAPQPAAPTVPMDQASILQRRMGINRPRPTLGQLGEAYDHAAYNLGANVNDMAAQVLPEKGAAALGFAANVGMQAAPSILGGEAFKLFSPTLANAGRSLMQSAVKPTLDTLRDGSAAKAITTMLDEGYNASKGGVEAMKAKIAQLGDEVSQAIANSPATVDKGAVASRLQDTLKRFETQVNPAADSRTIQNAWTEFLNHPLLAGKQQIPVQLAQDLKQGTYRALGSKAYGEVKGAEMEAQKALARGLKEEISAAVPAVAPLNAREAALINAKDIAERRVLMQGNNNPMGLAALAPTPSNFAAFMLDKNALVKSLLARSIYSGQEQLPALAGRIGGGALGMYSSQPPAPYGALYQPWGALQQQ